LHLAQEAEGYVTPRGVEAVAEALGLRVDEVDSVVSFYSMFFKRPVGRSVIKVCTSISCYLRGSDALVAHFERSLGIRRGETTADGAVTLLPTECLAACGGACALQVNDEIVEQVTPESADTLIARLRASSTGTASAGPTAERHHAEGEV
jgi:NADH:ubiquinone oxidoreductase subunit E